MTRKVRLGDLDDKTIEVILEDDTFAVATPDLYQLEEMLDALRAKYPVDVWSIRRQLKWVMRKTYKHSNMYVKNPWWTPRKFRR